MLANIKEFILDEYGAASSEPPPNMKIVFIMLIIASLATGAFFVKNELLPSNAAEEPSEKSGHSDDEKRNMLEYVADVVDWVMSWFADVLDE